MITVCLCVADHSSDTCDGTVCVCVFAGSRENPC